MFKLYKSKSEEKNTIYKADEKTRRAIDALYVAKSSRTKMVVGLTVLALVLGFGGGLYVATTHTYTGDVSKNNVVELKVSNTDLKELSQSK